MANMETAKVAAEQKSQPGTFNFLDRVLERDYPTKEIPVYLDEKSGLKIQELLIQHAEATSPKAITNIENDLELWRKKAKESRYIVHLEGVSTKTYDEIVDAAQAEFPLEYRETRHPLTMALERTVIENDDRELYFRTHLWAKFIRKVEDAQGNVDTNITPEFVGVMLGALPIAGQAAIADGVDELRMITAWMDNIQDADFLAKS